MTAGRFYFCSVLVADQAFMIGIGSSLPNGQLDFLLMNFFLFEAIELVDEEVEGRYEEPHCADAEH